MNTRTTPLDLDSFGPAVGPVVRRCRLPVLPFTVVRARLRKSSALIGAVVITPIVLAVLSVVALGLLIRLMVRLAAENRRFRSKS